MLIEFLQLSGQQIYTVSCTVCYRNKNDPISFNRGNNTPEKNIFRPKGRCKWHFFKNLNVGYKQKPKKETPEAFPSTVINFSKIFTNYIFHPPQPPWPVHRWCLISDTNNTPDLGHTMTGGGSHPPDLCICQGKFTFTVFSTQARRKLIEYIYNIT